MVIDWSTLITDYMYMRQIVRKTFLQDVLLQSKFLCNEAKDKLAQSIRIKSSEIQDMIIS